MLFSMSHHHAIENEMWKLMKIIQINFIKIIPRMIFVVTEFIGTNLWIMWSCKKCGKPVYFGEKHGIVYFN